METVLFVPDKTLYRIINDEGQTVLTGSINNGKANRTQHAKDLYNLQLQETEGNTEIKIIKKKRKRFYLLKNYYRAVGKNNQRKFITKT